LNLETKNEVMYDSFPKLFIMGSLHHSECHFGTQIDAVCTRQALGSDIMHAHTHTPSEITATNRSETTHQSAYIHVLYNYNNIVITIINA